MHCHHIFTPLMEIHKDMLHHTLDFKLLEIHIFHSSAVIALPKVMVDSEPIQGMLGTV